MGFLDFLKNNSDEAKDTYQLLREVTALKNCGDINGAINLLRDTLQQASDMGEECGVETCLRLPLYLQKAGRRDEAWYEFNQRLLHEMKFAHREMVMVNCAMIYDKMRLFQQRDGKFIDAVSLALMSYAHWAIGYQDQKRFAEWSNHVSPEAIEKAFKPHMKKAKKLELLPELVTIVHQSLKSNKKSVPRELHDSVKNLLATGV